MSPARKIALAGGLLYLLTFAASIPQLKLFATVVDDPEGFVTGPGSNLRCCGAAGSRSSPPLAGIGTAVALYPVTRRVSRTAAIGFVTSRVVEAALILVGVVSLLTVVTLRQDLAGATGARADALRVTGHALVALRQWTFLLGPGVMAGINGAVPRLRDVPVPAGPAHHPDPRPHRRAADPGLRHRHDLRPVGPGLAAGAVLALPVAAWEFSLGVWLTVKGFRAEALAGLGE